MEGLSIGIVVLLTLVALFAASYSYGEAHLKRIKENWVQYRCNPLYMPLAGMVGSDLLTTFMGCTLSAFQAYAGYALDPVYSMFDVVGGSISDIQGTLNDFRDMITGTKNAFLSIVGEVYDKLQTTLSVSAQLMTRIQTLMHRMLAGFVVIFHIITTGTDTGMSVANGPVGQTANFFCFAPLTKIRMEGGGVKSIEDIKIGHRLLGGAVVTSFLELDGKGVPMYSLGGDHVSSNHKVKYNGNWIRVENHPRAVYLPARSYPIIYCLNTTNHTIPGKFYLYKDYEETSDPTILRAFESMVEMTHNTSLLPENKEHIENAVDERRTGVYGSTEVLLSDGTLKPISKIKVGDVIASGGHVSGVVEHRAHETPISLGGSLVVMPGTWLFKNNKILTAECVGERFYALPDDSKSCYNLLTEQGYVTLVSGSRFQTILDDQETVEDWIHTWRDTQVQLIA